MCLTVSYGMFTSLMLRYIRLIGGLCNLEAMENDAGDSTIRKGMCNEEEGDENGWKKIRRTDFAQQSTCEQASRGYEANWEIIMPPSGISVVVLDIEYKCEFVHVPMDVPAPYVANFKPTGVVSNCICVVNNLYI